MTEEEYHQWELEQQEQEEQGQMLNAVPYTHLTLPTNNSV